MILVTLALVVAAPDPGSLTAPRKAYEACLRAFEAKSVSDKMTKAAYGEAVKTACPDESQKLVNALVAYDVAMGTKRATALSNAQMDLADYWSESQERFADKTDN